MIKCWRDILPTRTIHFIVDDSTWDKVIMLFIKLLCFVQLIEWFIVEKWFTNGKIRSTVKAI